MLLKITISEQAYINILREFVKKTIPNDNLFGLHDTATQTEIVKRFIEDMIADVYDDKPE